MTAITELLVPVTGGIKLAVRLSNPSAGGVPVLLVHGLASNARTWDGVADRLASLGHPVAALDQRGHGRSEKPDTGYDFDTVCADLAAVVAWLGWSRPLVAGQSWGGNVVLELAVRRPDAVGAIACVDGGTLEVSVRFSGWEECRAALTPPRLTGITAVEFEKIVRTWHPDWSDVGVAGTLANMEVRQDGTIAPWLTLERHLQIVRQLWEHHPRTAVAAGRGAGAAHTVGAGRRRRDRGRGGGADGAGDPGAGVAVFRAPTTTCTCSTPSRSPTCCITRLRRRGRRVRRALRALRALRARDRPRDDPAAGRHGLGRDQPDHGEDPSRGVRPTGPRRREWARGAARHPVRVSGERRRHRGPGHRLLQAQRGPDGGGGEPPAWRRRRHLADRGAGRVSARPVGCSPGPAARPTRCASGRAPRSRPCWPTSSSGAGRSPSPAPLRSRWASSRCRCMRSTRSAARWRGPRGWTCWDRSGCGWR